LDLNGCQYAKPPHR